MSTEPDINDKASWVLRQRWFKPAVEVTEGHRRCLNVIGSIVSGLYNIQHPGGTHDATAFRIMPHDRVEVDIVSSLGTYDFSELTALVVAAHEHAVRVELSPTLVFMRYDGHDSQELIDMPEDNDWDSLGETDDDGGYVYPQAAIKIACNAREADRSKVESSWAWHPGLQELIEKASR